MSTLRVTSENEQRRPLQPKKGLAMFTAGEKHTLTFTRGRALFQVTICHKHAPLKVKMKGSNCEETRLIELKYEKRLKEELL